MAANRAVFLDRDGVIVVPIIRDGKPTGPFSKEEFKIFPDVEESLVILGNLGFLRILITNQPDIAYGNITLGDWLCIQGHVENLPLDDVFVCFETRYDDCECRKPKPGMILAAAKKWDIDFSRSYMIGDTASDTGAAKAAGVKSILIRASYNKDVASDYAAWSLREAAFLIKRLEGGEKQ